MFSTDHGSLQGLTGNIQHKLVTYRLGQCSAGRNRIHRKRIKFIYQRDVVYSYTELKISRAKNATIAEAGKGKTQFCEP